MTRWQWQNKQLVDETGRRLATYSRDYLTVAGPGQDFQFAAVRNFGPRLDATMDLPVSLRSPESSERPEIIKCSVRAMGLATTRLSVQCGDRGYVLSRKEVIQVPIAALDAGSSASEVKPVAKLARHAVGRRVAIDWVASLPQTDERFMDRLFIAWVARLAYGPGDLRV